MTIEQRLERDLPEILGDLSMGPYPDYIDDVLTTTARKGQRPGWTFPERWITVQLATSRVPVARMPWRQLGVLALIAILLAAAIAVYIGTRPQRLPPPFGRAANGAIAYEFKGDIYTADPTTGAARAIVATPDTDVGPRFSRDGTHIVFERRVDGGRSQLYVMQSDGTDLTLVTPEPLHLTSSVLGEPWEQYQFAPDGRSVLIASTDGGLAGIVIAQSDGSGVRRLDAGMAVTEPSFRPPDGREILFVGKKPNLFHGIFAIDPATETVRTIRDFSTVYDVAGANWSPDGSRIAYWAWGGPGSDLGISAHTHVVSADGAGDRLIDVPDGVFWTLGSDWSNDGTRLFMLRGYSGGTEDERPAVVPVDGSSLGVEIPYDGSIAEECCGFFEWAPDDSKILVRPAGPRGVPKQQAILELTAGRSRATQWASTSDPAWQRIAP